MGLLDETIDDHVRALVAKEVPGFDPTKIEWVSQLPREEPGLRIIKIGSVRDVIVCVAKKGAEVLSVMAIMAGLWEAIVFSITCLTPNNLPATREIAEIVRSGTVRAIDEGPAALQRQYQHAYFVADEDWAKHLPSNQELQRFSPDPFGDEKFTLVNSVAVSGTTFQNSTEVYFESSSESGS